MPRDSITGIPNTGARRRSHNIIPDQGDDYVLGGCNLSYDGSRLVVGGGTVTIADGDTVYAADIDERVIPSPASGDVYFDLDPSGPSGDIVVGTSPATPRLKLGSVDTSAGTTSEANRDPDLTTGSFSTEHLFSGRSEADIVVWSDDQDYFADTRDSTLTSGTFETAFNSAISNAGNGDTICLVDTGTITTTKNWDPNTKQLKITSPYQYGAVIDVDVGAGNDAFLVESSSTILGGGPTFENLTLSFASGRHGFHLNGEPNAYSHPRLTNLKIFGAGGMGVNIHDNVFEGYAESVWAQNCSDYGFAGTDTDRVPEHWEINNIHTLESGGINFRFHNSEAGLLHSSGSNQSGVYLRGRWNNIGKIFAETATDDGMEVRPAGNENFLGMVRVWNSGSIGLDCTGGKNYIGYLFETDSTSDGLRVTSGASLITGVSDVSNLVRTPNADRYRSLFTPTLSTTQTLSSGASTNVTLSDAFVGRAYDVVAFPANDPGNAHGYSVDKTRLTSGGDLQVTITETESDGGGDVQVVAYPIH